MALTLEQLDQFGTLEQVPYSFDHTWQTDEVCGDWRLEDIDSFGTRSEDRRVGKECVTRGVR